MTTKLTLRCMDEMYKMMRYHSRIGCKPVPFTRDELYNLMEKVWPYVSNTPLRNYFPTNAVWAQFTRKQNSIMASHAANSTTLPATSAAARADGKPFSTRIVSTKQWRTEYDNGVKIQRQTIRWAVHLPPHYRGHGGSQ